MTAAAKCVFILPIHFRHYGKRSRKISQEGLGPLNLLVFEDPGREGLALGDLARRLQFPAATTHNLLKTLCACGYASLAGVGCYTVGPRCLEIGRFNHLLTEATATAIRARIEALGRRLNETVTFAVLADGRRLRLWSSVPGHLVRIDPAALETRKLCSVPTDGFWGLCARTIWSACWTSDCRRFDWPQARHAPREPRFGEMRAAE